MAYVEESPAPVVAAINGACFGGKLELALACHYGCLGKAPCCRHQNTLQRTRSLK